MTLRATALWMAVFAPVTAMRRGVDLWADPESFHAPMPEQSLADAVHGNENLVMSTYRQRLVSMGQSLGALAAPQTSAPATSAFDPELLKFQIRATVHDGYPIIADRPPESQPMQATEKAPEENEEYTSMLGLSSLRDETEFYNNLDGHSAPAPAPALSERQNPLWQQQNPRITSLRQQFGNIGNVFQTYQHFLRGSASQQTSSQAVAPPKKDDRDESVNEDTLLAVAAVSKPNSLMEQEAQVLAKNFESETKDPMQNALNYKVPDIGGGGELTAAEAQRWREMTHLSHLERDRRVTTDDPFSNFSPGLPAHANAPTPVPEGQWTVVGPPPRPHLWIPPTEVLTNDDALPNGPAAPLSPPARSPLWDPPNQAADEILSAHGQSAASHHRPITDLWAAPSNSFASSLEKKGIFVPNSMRGWDDVLKRYKSRIKFPYRA